MQNYIMDNILVIKHGALGDIFLAIPAFASIKKHHPNAIITIMTQSCYIDLLSKMPYFNYVISDDRKAFWNLPYLLKIIKQINQNFQRVYDLQCSKRTAWYHSMIFSEIEWFGRSPKCSHPIPFNAGEKHVIDSYKDHFQHYNIAFLEAPYDMSWLHQTTSINVPKNKYALIIPACSPKHHQKHWTIDGFAAMIKWLYENNYISVLVGAGKDKQIIDQIKTKVPLNSYEDWYDASPIPVVSKLAHHAKLIIGLDTGPMHCAASSNTPCIILFSNFKSPKLCAPKGPYVNIIESDDLKTLRPKVVINKIKQLLA